MKVYLSGPMTGIADYNFPEFNRIAAAWRERYDPETLELFNPAEAFGGDKTLPYSTYIRNDIYLLLQSNSIAMLPGWRNSRGARFELLVAQMLDLQVYNAVTFQKIIAPKISTFVDEQLVLVQSGSMPCFTTH